MKSNLKNLVLGLAILTITVTLAGVSPNFAALAQTAAPSAAASLPEPAVKALQEALKKQGMAVTVNGVLDSETRAAIRRYQSQHHLPVTGEPDKATLDKLGVATQPTELPGDSQAAGETASDQAASGMAPGMMDMMTPEMMQMMQRMMGQGGMAGMAQGGMGPGMMGQGQMPMAGGMMMCPMMQMMMGSRAGMNMPGAMGGSAMLHGLPHGAQMEMTPERVRTLLEQHLTRHGNPRLRLGEITTAKDGSITAEIMTVDGSLVQKLAFNRYPGLFRQVQ